MTAVSSSGTSNEPGDAVERLDDDGAECAADVGEEVLCRAEARDGVRVDDVAGRHQIETTVNAAAPRTEPSLCHVHNRRQPILLMRMALLRWPKDRSPRACNALLSPNGSVALVADAAARCTGAALALNEWPGWRGGQVVATPLSRRSGCGELDVAAGDGLDLLDEEAEAQCAGDDDDPGK